MTSMLLGLISTLSKSLESDIKISLRNPLAYQSNRLYDVWVNDQHWIAKEFLKSEEFDQSPQREFDALQLIAHLDIVPQPIHFEPHTDEHNPYVIYEYLDGDMWDRYAPSAQELSQLSDLWLKMHSVTQDHLWVSRGQERSFDDIFRQFQSYFQRYRDWVEAEFPAGKPAIELCQQIFENAQPMLHELDTYDPPLQFCRADPRFANVIRRPDGRLGLVDWEDSGLRDPARDVGDMMTHPNQEDLMPYAAWQAFLKPYFTAQIKNDPHIERRSFLYYGLAPMFWLGLLLNAGVNRANSVGFSDWFANGIPTQARLRRHLARSLAYPNVDFSRHLERVKAIIFFPE